MTKKRPMTGILLIVLAISMCGQKATQSGSFITVAGTQLMKGGKPYYYLGTNLWYGANMGSLGEGGNRDRLIRELDHLQSLGINNLRILGASEGGQFNTVRPSLQPQLGQYDEAQLKGLDFLLAEMSKRDMYAVIFLNNYWVWSGGMAQYVSWLEDEPVPNPFMERYSWDEFMCFSARFYTNEKATRWFREYVKMLITRTNTVTGRKYRDDPTIMAWQLANEPRPESGTRGKANFDAYRKWIAASAAFIKSLDPNHLVSTGNEGLAGSMQSEQLYLETHRLAAIDYMTFHLWILNWQWYDPLNPEKTFPDARRQAADYIERHSEYADRLGKPTVLEEFGIPRDRHSYSPTATTIYRDRYYTQIFRAVYESSKLGGPLVGSNFWTWSGEGRPVNPEAPAWQPGDPYTGDPPQEPQGRNSVFSSDQSTLRIIRTYATKMNALSK